MKGAYEAFKFSPELKILILKDPQFRLKSLFWYAMKYLEKLKFRPLL